MDLPLRLSAHAKVDLSCVDHTKKESYQSWLIESFYFESLTFFDTVLAKLGW